MECVEKLTNSQTSEDLPYGIPGSSRVSGSQEEPIIISSEEDVKIKLESKKKTVSGNNTKKAGKRPVQSSSSSSDSSSSNLPFYLKRNDMPKELDETLRVNENINY